MLLAHLFTGLRHGGGGDTKRNYLIQKRFIPYTQIAFYAHHIRTPGTEDGGNAHAKRQEMCAKNLSGDEYRVPERARARVYVVGRYRGTRARVATVSGCLATAGAPDWTDGLVYALQWYWRADVEENEEKEHEK